MHDPCAGKTERVALGPGSSPLGVIQGPDGAAWLTDGGQQAVVRVGWRPRELRSDPLPAGSLYAKLNTADVDADGHLGFTGQSGLVGKVDIETGTLTVHDPASGSWRARKLPGDSPRVYAVYVDERDIVWTSEWTANAVHGFDPERERFERHALPRPQAGFRQILGRKGEI